MSSASLFNLRAGWQRFQEPNIRQHEGFDPTSLGFSQASNALFGGARYFPLFDFSSLSDIGENLGAAVTHSISSVQPTFTRILGRHSIRAGYDLRVYREREINLAAIGGSYMFEGTYTRASSTAGNQFGQDIASFLLGIPTGGSVARNAQRLNTTPSGIQQAADRPDECELRPGNEPGESPAGYSAGGKDHLLAAQLPTELLTP